MLSIGCLQSDYLHSIHRALLRRESQSESSSTYEADAVPLARTSGAAQTRGFTGIHIHQRLTLLMVWSVRLASVERRRTSVVPVLHLPDVRRTMRKDDPASSLLQLYCNLWCVWI